MDNEKNVRYQIAMDNVQLGLKYIYIYIYIYIYKRRDGKEHLQ